MTLMSFALSLAVLVPAIGAGVDSAMLYIAKERLNTAVQLAATKPADRAQRTFAANFPEGFMGATATVLEVKPDGRLTARVEAPTYFMRVFRVPSVTVTASAKRVQSQ